MPPKKRLPKNPERVDVKSNVQTVVVKVGEQKKKRTRRPRRKREPSGDMVAPMRQLPPVVYQVPAMTTAYTNPLLMPPKPPTSIAEKEPAKSSTPTILQDVGTVGTEGAVEILTLPTKQETLEELTEPVAPAKKPKQTAEDKQAEMDVLEAHLFSLTGVHLKEKISKTQLKKQIAQAKKSLYGEGFPTPPKARKSKKKQPAQFASV